MTTINSTEPTNDVPLTSAEIAGFMTWRGPGAYTVHAERRIRKLVAEAVRRERAACVALCLPKPGVKYSPNFKQAMMECAAFISDRGAT